jgi:hypothetical protein
MLPATHKDVVRDHLFVAALATGPKLATMTKGGAITPGDLGEKLIEIIERRNIDLVVLDPFIKSLAAMRTTTTPSIV